MRAKIVHRLTKRDLERIARTAHEVNRAYCQELGEDAHPEWSLIAGDEREQVRVAVRCVLDGTYVSLEDQHEAWKERRLAAGWTWGPIKDVADKKSPALVSWERLPEEQRAKCAIFRAVCVEVEHILMEPGL